MALGPLFSVPRTPEDLQTFSFANFDSHNRIAIAINAKYGINIQTFPIDPFVLTDPVILRNHQQAHNLQNGILGINGADYTEFDFSREDEFDQFIQLHGNEHRLAENKLGIG